MFSWDESVLSAHVNVAVMASPGGFNSSVMKLEEDCCGIPDVAGASEMFTLTELGVGEGEGEGGGDDWGLSSSSQTLSRSINGSLLGSAFSDCKTRPSSIFSSD